MARQASSDVIDIARWAADEDFPIYPVGSKPKRLVICPDDPPLPLLRPRQGYLFKEARGWKAALMWSEVIAYELSRLLAVDVPPTFVAIDSAVGEIGALIELFYPYPAAAKTLRLVHAADFMQESFANDRRGRPHALRENLAICRLLKVADPLAWWAEAILFDTLIGNTDRHPENWGFLIKYSGEHQAATLAPLYDNGTSLGYGIQETKLDPPWESTRIAEFIARGTHDIGWTRAEDGPTPHLALCARFFAVFEQYRPIAARMLAFNDEQVEEIVSWAEEYAVSVPFSRRRGHFIVQQLAARRNRLVETIGL